MTPNLKTAGLKTSGPKTCAGSCLCGQVAYEIDLPFQMFVNCHCSRCQKTSGSSHAANALVLPTAFRWLRGAEQVARFDLPEARSFAVSFCRHCGTRLPHKTRGGSGIIVPTGTLDADPGERPSKNLHWAARATWLQSDPNLPSEN